jgi:hypothetical protein
MNQDQHTFTIEEAEELSQEPKKEKTREAYAAEQIIIKHLPGGFVTIPADVGGKKKIRQFLCSCLMYFAGHEGIDDHKLVLAWVDHVAEEMDLAGALRELDEHEDEYDW